MEEKNKEEQAFRERAKEKVQPQLDQMKTFISDRRMKELKRLEKVR